MILSVLTTVRNGRPFLEEMLNSCRNQSISFYEHVIVDDGSNDGTLSFLQEYKSRNLNYPLVIIPSISIGRASALNLGLSHCKGDYIAIIDSDDVWHPKKLELQLEFMKNHGSIVSCTYSEVFFKSFNFLDIQSTPMRIFLLNDILLRNLVTHSSVIIKKSLCSYNNSLKSQLDYDMWLRICSAGIPIDCLCVKLVGHRIHNNQAFESGRKFRYAFNEFKLVYPFLIEKRLWNILIIRLIKLFIYVPFSRLFIKFRSRL